MKLTGKKFILLLLYAPTNGGSFNVPIAGRTRLMKMGFLFQKEVLSGFKKDRTFDEITLQEYFPWKYGPFSKDLLNDLEFLINQSYIEVKKGLNNPLPAEIAEYDYWVENPDEIQYSEYSEEVFRLTLDNGIPKALEIWDLLSPNQQELLTVFKKNLTEFPLDRILEYVYKKYYKEGFAEKSVISERYL